MPVFGEPVTGCPLCPHCNAAPLFVAPVPLSSFDHLGGPASTRKEGRPHPAATTQNPPHVVVRGGKPFTFRWFTKRKAH